MAHATTQLEVGSRALDWTEAMDGAHSFRSLFAELIVHNVSLVHGVMKGAGALLERLSPGALTQAYEEAKRAGRTGLALGVYRYRELWRTLEIRHRDLASEEGETFAALFGREFAATYEQLFSAAKVEPKAARAAVRASVAPGGEPRAARPLAAVAQKTPENHGPPMAKPQGVPRPSQGPTGTVVAPRTPVGRPSDGTPPPPTDRSR